MRARDKSTRVFVLHMSLFVALMIVGQAFVVYEGRDALHSSWAVLPLLPASSVGERTLLVPET